MNKAQQLDNLNKQLETLNKDISKVQEAIKELERKDKVNPWGINFDRSSEVGCRYISGELYLDTQLAGKAKKKDLALRRIREYIYDNDMGFEPDWGNGSQYKYYVFYSHRLNKLDSLNSTLHNLGLPFYLKTSKDAEQIIQNCETDLKILFGVNV